VAGLLCCCRKCEASRMKDLDRIRPFLVPPGVKISLKKDYDPGYKAHYGSKRDAARRLQQGVKRLAQQQDKLYAEQSYALLILFQAMDAAGKDSTIKHVMSGVNPQGCDVHSFKAPSSEELSHDYLWRCARRLPERGRIGIFNRSYYEEMLVVRVHPELLDAERLPPDSRGKGLWKHRFEYVNAFEKHLVENGIVVLKFFLNVSKDEQKKRFLERIDRPEKNWKFSSADVKERACWDRYQEAYEEVFNHTSTEWAPWYVIPADHKWFARLAVAEIIHQAVDKLKLSYPTLSDEHRRELQKAREMLEQESQETPPADAKSPSENEA
jgi:PPK2 family polyphosphate:nucleotide phosphotransferase